MSEKKSLAERQLEFFDRTSPRWGGFLVAIVALIPPWVFKFAGIGWLPSLFIAAMGFVPHVAGFMGKGIPKAEPTAERLARYWSSLFWSTLALLALFFLALCGIVFGWR